MDNYNIQNIIKAEELWKSFLTLVQPEINSLSFKTWFEPIKPVSFEENELIVSVPSQFFYEWIEEHYYNVIQNNLKKVFGDTVKLTYNVLPAEEFLDDENTLREPIKNPSSFHNNNSVVEISVPEKNEPLPFHQTNLNARYIFTNYIKGESNQLARAAAVAVANNPGGTSFNPLLIYGGTGLGKTHLIQAIGNYALENGKVKRVAYISSEKFTIEFVDAIQSDKIKEFSDFYRSMDILIVDDIQFFSGKERTQDSFFHTFNTLHQLGKQIILSSDKPPRELKGLDERLISRFQWGLVADIQPPDLETRTAILQKKCEDDNIEISSHVLDFIAANVTSNVRELEGCYIRLLAQASIENREINIELARDVLKSIVNKVRTPLTIEEIQKVVAEFFTIPTDLLRSKTRKQEVVDARQVSMYLAKILTNSSLKTIGLHFGGRDHSTVIHACQTVEDLMKTDSQYKNSIEQLQQKLELS